jgi:hypothetical protein
METRIADKTARLAELCRIIDILDGIAARYAFARSGQAEDCAVAYRFCMDAAQIANYADKEFWYQRADVWAARGMAWSN